MTFLEIVVEFLKRLALAVRTRKAGNVADIKPGVRAAFDNGGVTLHRWKARFSIAGNHSSGAVGRNNRIRSGGARARVSLIRLAPVAGLATAGRTP